MKLLTITLTAALLASPAVHAACTTDEVNAKAEQLAQRINQLTESNPQRAKEINEEIRQMEAKRTADQLGDECEAYDKRLKQIEEAEREADIPPAETQR
jgi:cell division protein FtsL